MDLHQVTRTGREMLGSRLGFILLAAGCAIGLGNIWRFPFIAGQNGGGLFVLLYLIFLAILGFPVLLIELAIGRAGRHTLPGALRNLQNKKVRFDWGIPGFVLFTGNMILLMFYSVVTGWLLTYTYRYCTPSFRHLNVQEYGNAFGQMVNNPGEQTFFMLFAVIFSMLVCVGGVRNVLEKVIKFMMLGLFALLIFLVIRALTLPNASAGLSFYLKPSLDHFVSGGGNGNLLTTVQAAMAHAFFTLSLGIGSIAIFGSYTSKDRSLVQEGLMIILLDTGVAICAGLIIFPACFSFGITPDSGPSLIFVTLPNVFNKMPYGTFWGILFFVFMSIAALSTLIAVFENLVAFGIDQFKWDRTRSGFTFGVLLALLSLPCIYGFNLWSAWHPLGGNSCVLDLEDFIVSDNLLTLGALCMTIFCTRDFGWGSRWFLLEVNTGKGLKFPRMFMPYVRWGVPVIIVAIWLVGLLGKFNLIPKI